MEINLIGTYYLAWILYIQTQSKQFQAPKTDENMSSNDAIEDMVQCATCAVHLPRSEAFLVGGIFYCSQSHIKRK